MSWLHVFLLFDLLPWIYFIPTSYLALKWRSSWYYLHWFNALNYHLILSVEKAEWPLCTDKWNWAKIYHTWKREATKFSWVFHPKRKRLLCEFETKLLTVSAISQAPKYTRMQGIQRTPTQKFLSYPSDRAPQPEFCHIVSILLCSLLFHLINYFSIRRGWGCYDLGQPRSREVRK